MKNIILLSAASLFLFACKQKDSKTTTTTQADSTLQQDTVATPPPAKPRINYDSLLLVTSKRVLSALKNKNFNQLGSLAQSGRGISFSPYGYIDSANVKTFTARQLQQLVQSQETVTWGRFDGTGDPIRLGIDKYFDRFVYDRDYLKADTVAVNQRLGHGNTLQNINQVFPGTDFVEFHFPGKDPRYGGMDWRSLRLVFRKVNNRPYLVAVVHDEWTI